MRLRMTASTGDDGGRGAGGGDRGQPHRGMLRGVAHHRPEGVIDGQCRQPLLVPGDLRTHERVVGGAHVPVELDIEHDDGQQEPQADRRPCWMFHCCGGVYFTTSAVTSSYCSAPCANSLTALMI